MGCGVIVRVIKPSRISGLEFRVSGFRVQGGVSGHLTIWKLEIPGVESKSSKKEKYGQGSTGNCPPRRPQRCSWRRRRRWPSPGTCEARHAASATAIRANMDQIKRFSQLELKTRLTLPFLQNPDCTHASNLYCDVRGSRPQRYAATVS